MTEEEQKALVKEAIELVKPIVIRIEKALATTKNHYGDYMAVLGMTKDKEERKKLASLLVQAGANKQGVTDALRVLE